MREQQDLSLKAVVDVATADSQDNGLFTCPRLRVSTTSLRRGRAPTASREWPRMLDAIMDAARLRAYFEGYVASTRSSSSSRRRRPIGQQRSGWAGRSERCASSLPTRSTTFRTSAARRHPEPDPPAFVQVSGLQVAEERKSCRHTTPRVTLDVAPGMTVYWSTALIGPPPQLRA